MSRKTFIWLFMFIGSGLGGYIPNLWDAGMFSMSSVFLTALGGLAGIWFGFKLGQEFGND
jgi:hypothetical protein